MPWFLLVTALALADGDTPVLERLPEEAQTAVAEIIGPTTPLEPASCNCEHCFCGTCYIGCIDACLDANPQGIVMSDDPDLRVHLPPPPPPPP